MRSDSLQDERPCYSTILHELGLMSRLNGFQPTIIGTPPLGIDTRGSDIDVACYASDLDRFATRVTESFSQLQNYACRETDVDGRTASCARFRSCGWPVELLCQTVPIDQQHGVRHFRIERRLLAKVPRLKDRIMELRDQGLKTEPAFAFALGLPGDPYRALLSLEKLTDEALLNWTMSVSRGHKP